MNDTGRRILLNCDMGESFGAWRMGDDVHSMPLVDQANLACGFHAGDPLTMRRAVELAVRHGVSIGAHPAYPDLSGFGRRSLACSAEEVHAMVLYQIGALDAFCRSLGAQVAYVKPHGALYNDLVGDDELLRAVLDACAAYRKGLPLMVLALADNGRELELADEADVPLLFEAFADRAYLPDGRLAPRRLGGAVHHDPQRIIEQALAIARGEAFPDYDGNPLRLTADSLCVHGDNPESLAVLRACARPWTACDPHRTRWCRSPAADARRRARSGPVCAPGRAGQTSARGARRRRQDLVPGWTTLMLHYDPYRIAPQVLEERLGPLLAEWHAWRPAEDAGRLHEIPVWYAGEDLATVAVACGLTGEGVIELHSAAEYRVGAIGFAPGFAYLGGLDPRLVLPRRATPRARVPAGSLAIAEAQTAIYPQASPGGWHLLGRSPWRPFDPAATPPCPLALGDRVRFVAIGREDFLDLGGRE